MVKKILLLSTGNAASALLSFLRNIFIARLISPEDYGIAATFAIVMSAIEMTTNVGLHQYIVRDDSGDDPKLQASLQGFHLARAAGTAVLLFFAAGSVAQFMGIPQAAWAFQVLALPRLMSGFVHFDVYRMQRRMNFSPLMIVYVAGPASALAIVLPLSWWMGDYRVMLYSIVLQEFVRSGVSHLMAERAYKLALDGEIIGRSLRFGWPLMLNSALLFAVFNGERVIVAREMGMETLGLFAMGVTLTLTPALLVLRVLDSFFLPILSRHKNDHAAFLPIAHATIQATQAGGLLLVIVTLFVTIPLVQPVLGTDYAGVSIIIFWLSLLQVLRDAKALSIVSIAKGLTGNDMIVNLMRAATLPVAWYAASRGAGPLEVVGIAMIGEAFGLFVGLVLLRNRVGVPLRPLILGYVSTFSFYAIVAICGMGIYGPNLLNMDLPAAPVLIAIAFLVSALSFVHLWRFAFPALRPQT